MKPSIEFWSMKALATGPVRWGRPSRHHTLIDRKTARGLAQSFSILPRWCGLMRALGTGVRIGLIRNYQPENGFLKVIEAAGVPSVVRGRCDEKIGAGCWPTAMQYGDAVAVAEAGIAKDGHERL